MVFRWGFRRCKEGWLISEKIAYIEILPFIQANLFAIQKMPGMQGSDARKERFRKGGIQERRNTFEANILAYFPL